MDIKFDPYNSILRLGLAVPISPELREKLRQDKWYVDPEGASTPPELGKKDIKAIDPTVVFKLPKLTKVNPKDIRTVKGKPFVVLSIEKPDTYKRVPAGMVGKVFDHPTKGPNYWPGEVVGFDVDTGDILTYTYDDVEQDLLSSASAIAKETLQKANEKIDQYNQKINSIDKATKSVAQLPPQLGMLMDTIDERVAALDSIISDAQTKLSLGDKLLTDFSEEDVEKAKPQAVKEWEAEIDKMLSAANLPEQDFVDTLFYRYMYKYEGLVQDLKSGKIKVPATVKDPNAFRAKLVLLAEAADKAQKEHDKKVKEEKVPVQDLNILDRETPEIQHLAPEDIPSSRKPSSYASYMAYIKSLKATMIGSIKDKKELQEIRNAVHEKLLEWEKLPEGFRSNKNISQTPQGKQFLLELIDWYNQVLGGFVRRYATDIISPEGVVNKKLFGRGGSQGNASVAIMAQHIYAIGKNLCNKLLAMQGPEAEVAVPSTIPTPAPA